MSRTHLKSNPRYLGTPVLIEDGVRSVVELTAVVDMAVDERGLVHGGFAFGLADYAAMLAVNDPYVVLGSAEVRFTVPVRVGEKMRAEARVESVEGKRRDVSVEVDVDGRRVLRGRMTCFVLGRHVLDAAKAS
ncbi:MAG TPA: hotdog domain-containing protein [Candidatus Bathyarchaeia archaeon]